MTKDYQVCWRGFIGGTTGYDNASRGYLLGLDRLGIDVKIEPMCYGENIFTGGLDPKEESRLRELIDKPYAEDKKKILVYHAQPNGVDPVAERERYDKVIILTVWETTKVPDSWIDNANAADAIIIPSKQNEEALKDSGIASPIYIVPHGSDCNAFKPENIPLSLTDARDKFTFLSVFQWQHRKAPEILLKAFWEEFSRDDNVCLIVKTYWGSHVISKQESRHIMSQISDYKQRLGVSDSAPIYLSTSIFEDADLKGLYTTSDCFVLPTRGEGVGLPYMEALSSGIPVIATAWGGSMDFLNSKNSYLVDYQLLPTDSRTTEGISPNFNQLFTPEMRWAEPDVGSLRRQMRWAYDNQELAKEMGEQGRKDMEKISWGSSAVTFKSVIEEVLG